MPKAQQPKPNQYPGPCVECGAQVKAGEGVLAKDPTGRWAAKHSGECPPWTVLTPGPVVFTSTTDGPTDVYLTLPDQITWALIHLAASFDMTFAEKRQAHDILTDMQISATPHGVVADANQACHTITRNRTWE